MSGKQGRTSIMFRYTVLLFAVIIALAGVVSFVLLQFAADRFESYELSTIESSMQIAADDLENQYEVLEDIATKIQVTSYYQPSILQRDAYREIDLLKDFVNFKNFSPVLKRYFMFYPLASQTNQKIYTSEGNTAYFPYYASNYLNLDMETSKVLFERIARKQTPQCIVIDSQVLLVFPIRFVETKSPENSATVVFMLPLNTIQARMQQMASNLPDSMSIQLCGMTLCDEAQLMDDTFFTGIKHDGDENHLIGVASVQRSVRMIASIYQNKWQLLSSALSGWLFAGMALCLLVTVAVSVTLAQLIARPLRHMIQQHMPPGERFKNEFVQLEELVSRMERENGSSMQQLRTRILLTILRGYYSESLLERWGLLHLRFDRQYYCALVIDSSALDAETAEQRLTEIERLSDDDAVFFAVYVPEDRVIAVITGFDDQSASDRSHVRLQALVQSWQTVCSAGKVCDTPQRLSISYMEAMTAHLRARKWQSEDLSNMHTFALQMVTAAERRDEDGMHLLCDQLMQQMDEANAPRSLVNQLAVQLTTELSALASEKNISLDYQRAGMLILLPDMKSLLREAYDLINDTFIRSEEIVESRVDATAQSIVEYVQENAFDADFDLSRIADSFGLSNDYVSMMIKKITGSAFKEYLTELRLAHACKLLRERPEMTVNDISLIVGYRKASNFIKKFKETYGCTPTQYR